MAEAAHAVGVMKHSLTKGHLTDVDTTGKSDGQVLTYSATSKKWKPQTPSGGGGTHNLLSTTHPDTLPASVVIGDMVYGNGTPLWARLPIGSVNQVLGVASGLPTWVTEALLSAYHSDTVAASPVAGDLIAANSTPAWARLPVGSSGQVLSVVSGAPAWANLPTIGKGCKYYLGSAQSVAGGYSAYELLNTKVYDDYSEWGTDTGGNYCFTPTLSGRYFIAMGFSLGGLTTSFDGTLFLHEFMNSSAVDFIRNDLSYRITATGRRGAAICGTGSLVAGTHYYVNFTNGGSASVTLTPGEAFTWVTIFRLF
jgi:hypothetical protein